MTAGVLIAGVPTTEHTLVLGSHPAAPAQSGPPVPPAAAAATTITVVAVSPAGPGPAELVAVVARPGNIDAIDSAEPIHTVDSADATLERGDIDLVVANGARKAGLAGDVAAALGELGWGDMHVGNAIIATDRTTIYFAPGLTDEAHLLAADLGLPEAELAEVPGGPVLADDSYIAEHLTVVLGTDARG